MYEQKTHIRIPFRCEIYELQIIHIICKWPQVHDGNWLSLADVTVVYISLIVFRLPSSQKITQDQGYILLSF